MTFAAVADAAVVAAIDAAADYVRANCFETGFVAAIAAAHYDADW